MKKIESFEKIFEHINKPQIEMHFEKTTGYYYSIKGFSKSDSYLTNTDGFQENDKENLAQYIRNLKDLFSNFKNAFTENKDNQTLKEYTTKAKLLLSQISIDSQTKDYKHQNINYYPLLNDEVHIITTDIFSPFLECQKECLENLLDFFSSLEVEKTTLPNKKVDEKTIEIDKKIINEILEELKPYFFTNDYQKLELLLNSNKIERKIIFRGYENKLSDVLGRLKYHEKIYRDTESIAKWIQNNFVFKPFNDKDSKLGNYHSILRNVKSTKDDRCKRPVEYFKNKYPFPYGAY